MIQLLKAKWPIVLIVVVLLSAAAWGIFHKDAPAPPLSPAQQKATEKGIAADQKQVGNDTARAASAAASGTTNYAAGQAYAEVGKVLHQQSKPYAKPTPVASDTAAARLQRALSKY
jgi:hypothetical protein